VAVQHVSQDGDDLEGFLVRQQHNRPRARSPGPWVAPIRCLLSVPTVMAFGRGR
jgi:hypothetical protein